MMKRKTQLTNLKNNTPEKGKYPLKNTFNLRSTEYKNVKKEIGKHIVKHLVLRIE